MRKRHLAIAVAALALALPLGRTSAADAQDGGLHLSLSYDGKILVKVLDIQLDERVSGSSFSTSTRLISSGILRLVKNIDERALAEGRIAGGDPKPGMFEYQRVASKSHRKVHTVWSDGQVSMTTNVPFPNLGEPPASLQQKLGAADPLTNVLKMALADSKEQICPRTYTFFDGKQLYSIEVYGPHPDELGDREKKLGLVNAFGCSARYREIAGFGKKNPAKPNSGFNQPIEIEFARVGAKGPWVLTHLKAHTPIGSGRLELSRLTVSGKAP